jgi:hypothetical protein
MATEIRHQPGQSVFRSVLPEDIDWRPFAAFPSSVRLAIVVAEPSAPGPYVIRVNSAHGREADAPQTRGGSGLHGDVRHALYIGLGDQFNADKLDAYPPAA